MEKIPTAKELIDKIDEDFYAKHSYYLSISSPVLFAKAIAIEFAKLHVEECKKEIANKAIEYHDSILNSYPLDKIK